MDLSGGADSSLEDAKEFSASFTMAREIAFSNQVLPTYCKELYKVGGMVTVGRDYISGNSLYTYCKTMQDQGQYALMSFCNSDEVLKGNKNVKLEDIEYDPMTAGSTTVLEVYDTADEVCEEE